MDAAEKIELIRKDVKDFVNGIIRKYRATVHEVSTENGIYDNHFEARFKLTVSNDNETINPDVIVKVT